MPQLEVEATITDTPWDLEVDVVCIGGEAGVLAAGLVAIHVRRGPWGYLQQGAEQAHIRLDSLAELPEALARA